MTHPNIPEEVKKRIEQLCIENSTTEDGPFDTYETLVSAATFGYSLCLESTCKELAEALGWPYEDYTNRPSNE